jgi:hypothetical protein
MQVVILRSPSSAPRGLIIQAQVSSKVLHTCYLSLIAKWLGAVYSMIDGTVETVSKACS